MNSIDEQRQIVWSREHVTISPARLKRRFYDLLKSPFGQGRNHLYASLEPTEVLESDLCVFGFYGAFFLGTTLTTMFAVILSSPFTVLPLILITVWFARFYMGFRKNENYLTAAAQFRKSSTK